MSYIRSLLFILCTISMTIVPQALTSKTIQKLNDKKQTATKGIRQFIRCLMGDKECKKEEIQLVRAIAAVVAVVSILTTGGSFLGLKIYDYYQQTKTAAYMYPLHLAASEGDINGVEALLNAGINVNSTTIEGSTPLQWAIIMVPLKKANTVH